MIVLTDGCISRLDIDKVEQDAGTLVVEGQITDAPGPYQVKIFRSTTNTDNLSNISYLIAKKVTLFDDVGESEELVINTSGIYETQPNGIRGRVGRKYAIHIEMIDGTIFESVPDELLPVGEIENLNFVWESVTPLSGPVKNGFKVFLDTRATDSFLRWRFSGTYMLEAFPELRRLNGANCAFDLPPPDPPECSGWRYDFISRFNPFAGGNLVQFGDCNCCMCWVTDRETRPHINENLLPTGGTFKNVQVGYVPFDQWTFGRGKYMVMVEQMSLTEEAYQFWKIIKDQKDGTGSLFQPAFGKTKTNLFSINSDKPVMGIFYASAIRKEIRFLTGEDAPIEIPPYNVEPRSNCVLWNSCEQLSSFNASRNPPADWQ